MMLSTGAAKERCKLKDKKRPKKAENVPIRYLGMVEKDMELEEEVYWKKMRYTYKDKKDGEGLREWDKEKNLWKIITKIVATNVDRRAAINCNATAPVKRAGEMENLVQKEYSINQIFETSLC